MQYQVDDDLIRICRDITSKHLSELDWSEVESDDMIQTDKYEGGFDAAERAFCFAAYLPHGEHWFQITLEEVELIANNQLSIITIREAEGL